jgi:hypothetical protein
MDNNTDRKRNKDNATEHPAGKAKNKQRRAETTSQKKQTNEGGGSPATKQRTIGTITTQKKGEEE